MNSLISTLLTIVASEVHDANKRASLENTLKVLNKELDRRDDIIATLTEKLKNSMPSEARKPKK